MSSAVSRFLLKIIINKTKQNQTLLLETTDVETALPIRSWRIPDSFFEAPALRKMTRLYFNFLPIILTKGMLHFAAETLR